MSNNFDEKNVNYTPESKEKEADMPQTPQEQAVSGEPEAPQNYTPSPEKPAYENETADAKPQYNEAYSEKREYNDAQNEPAGNSYGQPQRNFYAPHPSASEDGTYRSTGKGENAPAQNDTGYYNPSQGYYGGAARENGTPDYTSGSANRYQNTNRNAAPGANQNENPAADPANGHPTYGDYSGYGQPNPAGYGNAGQYQNPGFYQPQPPVSHSRKQKGKYSTGIKVFALILAGVILIVGSYFVGNLSGDRKNDNRNNNDNTPNTTQSAEESSGVTGDKAEFDMNVESGTTSKSALYSSIAEKVLPSVVSITVYTADGSKGSSASGVVLSKDGYILTNDHIYENIGAPSFLITMSDETEYSAKWVSGDSRSDLAILKIEGVNDLTPATFSSSDSLKVGEEVIAIGQSYGLPGTVTSGIISALNRRVTGESGYNEKFIQTTTAINPGNSGGALVDMNGQVVGITSAKIANETVEGICFAIPSKRALEIVDSLKANGKVVGRAQLGITYTEVSTVLAEVNDIPTGLYIATINEKSGLNGKGFVKGDIITKINGEDIKNSNQVLDVVEASSPGDTVSLTIYKSESKKTETVDIKLMEYVGTTNYSDKVQESSAINPFSYFGGGNNENSNGGNYFDFGY